MHKQVQSKTYRVQGALTAVSTTDIRTQLKQHQKRFIKELKSILETKQLNLNHKLKSAYRVVL